MSGHWRFCVTAFLVFAGLSTAPAFSNPLADLFNLAPKEATTAPSPAREAPALACVPQPGRSTAPGQHWVYRLDGHRKCWFQAAEGTASVKKHVHHYAAKRPATAPEEDEAAPRKKTVVDARAQLLSAEPADSFQPTPPARDAVDTVSVPAIRVATLVPAAPIEMLLAAAPPARGTVASSVPPAALGAPSIPEADEEQWEWIATRAGAVLIALGVIFLLGGSLLANLFGDPRVAPIGRA